MRRIQVLPIERNDDGTFDVPRRSHVVDMELGVDPQNYERVIPKRLWIAVPVDPATEE